MACYDENVADNRLQRGTAAILRILSNISYGLAVGWTLFEVWRLRGRSPSILALLPILILVQRTVAAPAAELGAAAALVPLLDLGLGLTCWLVPGFLHRCARGDGTAADLGKGRAADPVPAAVDLGRHLDPEKRRPAEQQRPIDAAQLRLLLANAPAVFFALDGDGVFTFLGGRHLDRLGLKEDVVVGFSAFDIYAEHREVQEHLRAALTGEARQWVAQLGDRYFETRTLPLRPDGETVEGLVGVANDITEHKLSEAALQTSETKFSLAFNASPDSIVIATVPEGKILEVNASFEKITGYGRDEVLGRTTEDIRLWHDPEQRRELFRQMSKDGKLNHHETLFRMRGGDLRTCLISAKVFDLGTQRCAVSVVHDITDRKAAEQALRQSEERFATAFRASPDAIMMTSIPRGRLVEVNEGFSRITGYSREQALGETTTGLGLWAAPTQRQEMLARVRVEGRIRDFELEVRDSWGKNHVCVLSAEVVTVQGEPCLLSVVRDVTEWRRAEASRRRLSNMLEAISDFVAIAEFDGRLSYLNLGGRRMVGLAESTDITSYHVTDFQLPDEARWLRRHVLPKIETLGVWSGESIMLGRDGRRVPVLQVITYHAGRGPEDGAFLSTMAHDITERKRMEEALVSSEERFSKAFHASPDAIMLTSMPLGSVLEVNQGFTRLTGYTRGETVGRSTTQLNMWQDPGARRNMLDRLSRAGQIKDWEVEVRDRDGDVHNCMLTGEMIELGAKPCLLLMFRDVTEKRRAEAERDVFVGELEAKNAELERFTYTVSHDLKSPLVTIKGFIGMLRRDLDAGAIERAGQDIDRIQNAADTMAMLLDELLELSRVGRVVHPAEHVDLADLTREVAELLSGGIEERRVDLHISPDLPVVYGDRPRLREVMQNLLDNAIKFSRQGPTEPRIEVGRELRDGEQVFYVRDNGLGIDPRYHQKVFDLFDRLDPSIEGTGIGLALVKRIIEFHEGKVWVESQGVGHGTTFCFTLGTAAPEAATDSD